MSKAQDLYQARLLELNRHKETEPQAVGNPPLVADHPTADIEIEIDFFV